MAKMDYFHHLLFEGTPNLPYHTIPYHTIPYHTRYIGCISHHLHQSQLKAHTTMQVLQQYLALNKH